MRSYYVLSNGRVRRHDNTIFIDNEKTGEKRPIPIEDVASLYLFGEIDLNTRLLTFLASQHITVHVFNYYGFYAGTYYPRDYLHSGFTLVQQVAHYSDPQRRMALARELVRASAHSLLRNVAYYSRRRASGAVAEDPEPAGQIDLSAPSLSVPTSEAAESELAESLDADALSSDAPDPLEVSVPFEAERAPLAEAEATIRSLALLLDDVTDVNVLRGLEGKMRTCYYRTWPRILTGEWAFDRRVRRPPDNEVNALISFGNSMLYTVCLSELYRTQLTPTISYLHEPGARRFSLALDLSEIFKPLLVDRAIFRLLNTNQLKPEHFDRSLNSCYLADPGRKLFLAALEERLATTIHHRRLGRHVSYRHLIRLECYKLIRHITGVETYRAFRAWW
jgi:CRISPR-associated protein Cas1